MLDLVVPARDGRLGKRGTSASSLRITRHILNPRLRTQHRDRSRPALLWPLTTRRLSANSQSTSAVAMAATFRTRPWQLALLARPAFAPVLNNITPGLLAHSQQIRHAASKSRRLPPAFRISMKQTQRQHDLQEATSSLSSSMIKEQAAVSTAEAAVLAPCTSPSLPPLEGLLHVESGRTKRDMTPVCVASS